MKLANLLPLVATQRVPQPSHKIPHLVVDRFLLAGLMAEVPETAAMGS